MRHYQDSELILNADGSIFHLHLHPHQLAENIILVGDPDRVKKVSAHFSTIEFDVENREFRTVTGIFKGKRMSVISTGIGTDNIDIVINELDALANIDLVKRCNHKTHKTLNIVRIGTSGSLQATVPVDTYLLSEKSIGFDGVLNYYANRNQVSDLNFEKHFKEFVNWGSNLASPYVVSSSPLLIEKLMKIEGIQKGVTISAPGFYGPQGRELRLPLADPHLNDKITAFEYEGYKITNYEMESSAIAGLCALMGHHATTVCAIIANRETGEYSKDYHPVIKHLIESVLNCLL